MAISLNPIERIWDKKRKLEDKACKNLEELEQAVFQCCWQDIVTVIPLLI